MKRRIPVSDAPVHICLAVCDHFEPLHASDKEGALARIHNWKEKFPKLIDPFRDTDGLPPKHTFFYPVEQYDPDLLEPLASLCAQSGSEVEIHLHHEDDTPEGLVEALEKGKRDLENHGLLSKDAHGATRYGFIHGNWALNNSHPEGKGCGVDHEIPILRGSGCYADFTMASAPSPTQSRLVNTIAYAEDLLGEAAMNQAKPVTFGEGAIRREDGSKLLMINGPLALNWRRRKWGVIPRIETGDLTGANPVNMERLRLAGKQGISVEGKPDWVFVKFHTHGGIERNFGMLLGESMRRFHEELGQERDLRFHYMTARELANVVHAAEDGCEGSPGDYRNHCYRLVR